MNCKTRDQFVQFCLDNPIKCHRKPEIGKKYEAVFIDFRSLPHIQHVVFNCINKLSKDWSHTIVCGDYNYEYIKKITNGMKIKIIKLDIPVNTVNDYNNLLLTVDFWNLFKGEKILIYQEDTYLFHGDISPFMEYDYIGAPWVSDQVPMGYGGNGGLSLRTKNIMIDCLKYPPPKGNRFDKQPEDLYYCNVMYTHKIGKLAPRKVGVRFSQEQLIPVLLPMGGHKFWDARDYYNFVDLPYIISPFITLEKTKIPRNFVQTFRDNHVHKAVYQNVNGILDKNKGFKYLLINDSMGIELIEKHFDQRTLDAFKKLKAGAAKGDFIRYIAMYIHGGVYLDLDGYIARNISDLLDYEFVWIYDEAPNVIQWFFMTSPKHPILKCIIDEMVNRIHNKEQNIFLATGPTLVSDVIFGLMNNKFYYNNKLTKEEKQQLFEINKNMMNGLFMFENAKDVVFTFPGYQKEMLYNTQNPRYVATFNGSKTPNLYVE